MVVMEHPTLQQLSEEAVVRQAKKITADPSHILLYSQYELLPLGRRYRVPIKY